VIGVGADGRASLTAESVAILDAAELLCGGRRQLALFPDHPAERLEISGGLDNVLARLAPSAGIRRVVVLASGDPCFFGVGPRVASAVAPVETMIVPSVSSVALAFARLGLSWQDATVISVHGRELGPQLERIYGATKLVFLTDGSRTPAAIAEALLADGFGDAAAHVFEHLGAASELAVHSTLSALRGRVFNDPNLLVVLRDRPTPARLEFGRHERAFHHDAGLITHAEVRAVVLSKLRLPRAGVFWDIGSGSGSVAVEAAELTPGLAVYAIEEDSGRIAWITRNAADSVARARITVIHGPAPDALSRLPQASSVFIGGHNGRLTAILDACWEDSSTPETIVATFATLEGLHQALAWVRRRSVSHELVQLNVSRGSPVGRSTRLEALNPVFILTLHREPT
jgi:precorrin-6Y C5,15-methyltransferase (decarboxylating)